MPRGGYAPKIRGVHAKYVFEAMLTGPQAMDNFSNGNLSVEEKRDIIAYLQSLEDNPGYGGFGLGGIGPVSEGLFAWLVGIGSLVGRGHLDRRPHGPDVQDEGRGRGMSDDNLPETTDGDRTPVRVDEPIPNPGLEPHQWRPTDVDPKAEKRAERQVAGLFMLAIVGAILFVVSYFVFQIGDDPDTLGNLGASNVALGVCLAVTLLAMGAGIIQWARKLMGDHEIVEMRHTASSSQEDREATVGILKTGLEESGLGRRPLIRNTLLAAGGVLGILPIIMLRDLGPLPGDKLDHTIWDMNTWTPEEQAWWATQNRTYQRVVRDVVGTPILASRARDR